MPTPEPDTHAHKRKPREAGDAFAAGILHGMMRGFAPEAQFRAVDPVPEDLRDARPAAGDLEEAGIRVLQAENGKEGLDKILTQRPDIVISDITMPEMDGIELARRATELDPDLKVMFITGFAAVALNPDSEAPKDASVLSKPFHLKDLVSEVERLLAA